MVAGHYPGLGHPSVPQISTQVLLYFPGLFLIGTVDALTETFEIQRWCSRRHTNMQEEKKDVSQPRKGPKPDHSLYTHLVPIMYYLRLLTKKVNLGCPESHQVLCL